MYTLTSASKVATKAMEYTEKGLTSLCGACFVTDKQFRSFIGDIVNMRASNMRFLIKSCPNRDAGYCLWFFAEIYRFLFYFNGCITKIWKYDVAPVFYSLILGFFEYSDCKNYETLEHVVRHTTLFHLFTAFS